MKTFTTLLVFFFLTSAQAAVLISPIDAMKSTFGAQAEVIKKNRLLTKKQAAEVSKRAHMKLSTKIYRIYTASLNEKPVGYGVLATRKVRQKDATVLYMITPKGTIDSIEIIAFNEPPEYMPNRSYTKQFSGTDANDTLRVGKDVPTISGATLSARNVTDGARLALAVFGVLYGNKK